MFQSLSEKILKNKKIIKNDHSVNIKDYVNLINNTKNNSYKIDIRNTIIKIEIR